MKTFNWMKTINIEWKQLIYLIEWKHSIYLIEWKELNFNIYYSMYEKHSIFNIYIVWKTIKFSIYIVWKTFIFQYIYCMKNIQFSIKI